MSDFEKLQEALDNSGDDSYMNSLNRSLALVLDEFYNNLTAVGVSAASGDGMPALFKALDNAAVEFEQDYLPDLQRRVAEAKARQEATKQSQMEKLMADLAVSPGKGGGQEGQHTPGTDKPPRPGGSTAAAEGVVKAGSPAATAATAAAAVAAVSEGSSGVAADGGGGKGGSSGGGAVGGAGGVRGGGGGSFSGDAARQGGAEDLEAHDV